MKNERYELNKNLAQMLKGGVIMDVTTPEQAKIAEQAGAVAVMALERIPADIRTAGGVARMSDPKMIRGIQEAVSIPVMAKVRIGHFVEAQILEALEIDYIDESEVLSPADDVYHIDKTQLKVRFGCGGEDPALVDVVDLYGLQDLRLDNVADAALGHNGDGDCLLDALDHLGVRHPGHPSGGADVRRDPLKGHDRARAGLLSDPRLLGRGDVHDDAALQHLCQLLVEPVPLLESFRHKSCILGRNACRLSAHRLRL